MSDTPGPTGTALSPPPPPSQTVKRPPQRAKGGKTANWSSLPGTPYSDALPPSHSFLCFCFVLFFFVSKAFGERLPIFVKSLLGTSGWERACVKRSAGHRDFGHVFHDGPSCPDCGDNPPTHPFTLLLLCIFRQEFPSQLGANGMLPLASCLLPGSLCCSLRAERKTSYLITLHIQRKKPHFP